MVEAATPEPVVPAAVGDAPKPCPYGEPLRGLDPHPPPAPVPVEPFAPPPELATDEPDDPNCDDPEPPVPPPPGLAVRAMPPPDDPGDRPPPPPVVGAAASAAEPRLPVVALATGLPGFS